MGIFSGDDLYQEKSNVRFKKQIGDHESSERKFACTNDETRVYEYGSSSNYDSFQTTDLFDEPPKKREKTSQFFL